MEGRGESDNEMKTPPPSRLSTFIQIEPLNNTISSFANSLNDHMFQMFNDQQLGHADYGCEVDIEYICDDNEKCKIDICFDDNVRINIKTDQLYIMFLNAGYNGDIKFIENIVQFIPNINKLDYAGNNFLHKIIFKINYKNFIKLIEVIKIILKSGININHQTNNLKQTPIMLLAKNGFISTLQKKIGFEIFMDYGADINIKDKNRETVLEYLYREYRYKSLYDYLNTYKMGFYINESAKKRIKRMLINDENICSICKDIMDNDSNIYMTKCLHIFHNDCIERQERCPLCREAL